MDSWKGPEEDNMSIGELAEWLASIPANRQHLQVRINLGMHSIPMNMARLAFTDGVRYYADSLLKNRSTFEGIYLELDGEGK